MPPDAIGLGPTLSLFSLANGGPGTPVGDRNALLDRLKRELGRLRTVCHGPARPCGRAQ
jgi:hypothetical protein